MAERNPGLWDGPEGDAKREESGDPTQEAALGVAARHALHDEELIAAFAGGDLAEGPDTDRAAALVARCSACRDLNRDMAAIRTALQAAGTAADVAVRSSAPRDFRLTLQTSAQLRPGAWLRPAAAAEVPGRLWDRLGAAVASFGRPLGASFAALGIVGLLVGSLGLGAGNSLLGFGAAAPGATSAQEVNTTDAAGPDASERTAAYEPGESPGSQSIDTKTPSSPDVPTGAALLVAGSVAFIALGILFIALAARSRGRRGGGAP